MPKNSWGGESRELYTQQCRIKKYKTETRDKWPGDVITPPIWPDKTCMLELGEKHEVSTTYNVDTS